MSQRNRRVAAKAPASCAAMMAGASAGRMPAKVFVADRAANEVEFYGSIFAPCMACIAAAGGLTKYLVWK